MSSKDLNHIAITAIEKHTIDLKCISKELWENPEVKFEEKFAHNLLTDFLEKHGFYVERKTPIETAFIARSELRDGPAICIMCEYDALPGIGHACGHNLIAEAGVAAAIGVKAALDASESLRGTVYILGTPAEEAGGGKVIMIEKGCFDPMDVCLMVHPCPYDYEDELHYLAVESLELIFAGKAAHAAASPWEGINALDAAVACYNNVSLLRQQIQPECRIHGVFRDGGEKPNIIPRRAALEYYLRAPTDKQVSDLKKKVLACAEGAAVATGCAMEVKPGEMCYSNLWSNGNMRRCFRQNLLKVNPELKITGKINCRGSTDAGNVSQFRPTIHPLYSIPTEGSNHTEAFTTAAGADAAQQPTLDAAKAMAMTVVNIITDPELLSRIKEEFQTRKKADCLPVT